MNYVDLISTAIHFSPIVALFAVHCSDGRWPTDAECARRVLRYGFSIQNFSERPANVWTHLFVHISSQHFIANVLYLAATLVEVGGMAHAAADTEADQWSGIRHNESGLWAFGTVGQGFSTQGIASGMRVTRGRRRGFLQACASSAGAFFVWAVGGATGGLLSQLLYNNVILTLRRKRAARAAAAVAVAGVADRVEGGVGSQIMTSLFQGINIVRQRVEAWSTTLAVSAQESVNKSMVMCGASAGVCALSGFSAVFYGRPVTACCLVVPEVIRLAADLIESYAALLGPGLCITGTTTEAERCAVRSVWRTLMPGQTVGHAAHVGGFVVGMGMGYGWLWVLQRYRRLPSTQSRSRTTW